MAKNSNVIPVKVESINEINAAENITTLASTLKKYGLQPGIKLQQMLNVSNPVARKAIFRIVLILLCIIGCLSIWGSLYTTPVMIGVSVALSLSSIGILLLCYKWLKGGIKYAFLLIDIIIAVANIYYFVPAAFGHEATAERQRSYIAEEKAYADSILREANAYIGAEPILHNLAKQIAQDESAIKGQVYTTATNVKTSLHDKVQEDIPQEVTVPEEILYASINTLSQARKVGMDAHSAIAQQVNKALVPAQAFKLRIAGVRDAVVLLYNDSTLTAHSQRSNANSLWGQVERLNEHPDFAYKYKPKYVVSAVVQGKYSAIATILEVAAIIFLLLLITVIGKEEKNVNLTEAIAESKKLLANKLIAKWNIELGSDPEIDDQLTVILEWLEDHAKIRSSMVHSSLTLADFISLYKHFGEDILEMVSDGDSKFGLHELSGGLNGVSPDDYSYVIENFTYNEWLLLNRLVDDADAITDMVSTSVILNIWSIPCHDGRLQVTADLKGIIEFLNDYADLQKAVKASKATLQQYVKLYELYGETILLECSRPGANFAIGNLVDSLPERVSDNVLQNMKAAHLSVLDKYDISVPAWARLTVYVQDGLLEVISLLEAKIADEAVRKEYIAKMMKDLSVFTTDIVGAWKVLIANLRLDAVLLALTPAILSTLTADETLDVVTIINPYKADSAMKMLGTWRKEYSDIMADWKRKGIYDIEMQNIFNNVPSAGLNGIPTLMAAYQKTDKQLQELVRKDEKGRDDRKKEKEKQLAEESKVAPTPAESAAERVEEEASPSTSLELDVEETPVVPVEAEPAPEPAPVVAPEEEETLPERKVVLNITLSQLQKATDETAKLAVLEKAFKVETAAA